MIRLTPPIDGAQLIEALSRWVDEDERADAVDSWTNQDIVARVSPAGVPLDLVLVLAAERLTAVAAALGDSSLTSEQRVDAALRVLDGIEAEVQG
ncbi:MAG: hypothetical protein AAGA99_11670 [Actinomycetota bacterium]